jgi:hypothetical protein
VGVLVGCTTLAVLLWVALAVQTKRNNAMRAKQQQGATEGAIIACLLACAVCVGDLQTPQAAANLPACLLKTSALCPAAAASKRAAMALPVVVVQPDNSMDFGAKLYRTPSGGYR